MKVLLFLIVLCIITLVALYVYTRKRYTLYVFWTGDNEMSDNRKRCLSNLQRVSGVHVTLVTPDNLHKFIVPSEPLHPSYEHLSFTHRADYLRTYFMHFHGGGYSDIKETTGSWVQAFKDLESSNQWINGIRETEGGVAYGPVTDKYNELVTNCAYILKPQTPLTREWYSEMIHLLDSKMELLKMNPAKTPQDCAENSAYPIEWNEMLGRIFHKVCYKYKDKLLFTVPAFSTENYR